MTRFREWLWRWRRRHTIDDARLMSFEVGYVTGLLGDGILGKGRQETPWRRLRRAAGCEVECDPAICSIVDTLIACSKKVESGEWK